MVVCVDDLLNSNSFSVNDSNNNNTSIQKQVSKMGRLHVGEREQQKKQQKLRVTVRDTASVLPPALFKSRRLYETVMRREGVYLSACRTFEIN